MESLNNRSLNFKINTGADVTVIPERCYTPNLDGELKAAKLPVVGPTREKVTMKGKFTGTLETDHKLLAPLLSTKLLDPMPLHVQ